MQPSPEAFLLLSLPNCSLSSAAFSETGVLGLECVTIPLPEASSANDRDVYLVLRLNMSEVPIDPTRVIQRSDTPHARVYTFYSTPADPTELVLTVPLPPGDPKSTHIHEDLDTFEGILEQYATDFRTSSQAPAVPSEPPPAYASENTDLRGHLVMINEDTGEVMGEVEDRFRIKEDPVIHERGHENDPVIIEVSDEMGLRESDANAMEAFARTVPPDQQDWITKSASVVSHTISFTTNLLLTTITTASNYYVSKSSPSPHHSSSNLATRDRDATTPNSPPPLPPRALVFLTSERTRKGLRSVHTVSGQAVKVSTKTVRTIDSMIRRAMGARPKQNRLGYIPAPHGSLSPVPSASPPGAYTPTLAPPPIYPSPSFSPNQGGADSKPPLPPRRSPSPQPPASFSRNISPPALPPRIPSPSPHFASPPPLTNQGQPRSTPLNPLPQPKLSKTSRLLISADLILSTIDDSARRLLDTGTENIGRVVHHKYGPEAAESSLLAAGTARNVGLVYIDMKGIGRRALLRRAGKNFVKGRFQSGSGSGRPVPPVPHSGQQQPPQPYMKQ